MYTVGSESNAISIGVARTQSSHVDQIHMYEYIKPIRHLYIALSSMCPYRTLKRKDSWGGSDRHGTVRAGY